MTDGAPAALVSPDVFKSGMRRVAASVCLITTVNADGSRNGLTATAVCSLSAEPAALLCCLNRSSNSFAAIAAAKVFVVNVLSIEDRAIADHFAGNRAAGDKFQRGEWRTLASGAPALQTAIAHFDCRVKSIVPAATHGILIGEVTAVWVNPGPTQPLLFVDGGYGGFSPHDVFSAAPPPEPPPSSKIG